MPKIEALGQKEVNNNGKEFRRVTIDGREFRAYGFSCKNLEKFRVGDEIVIELSEDGKFLNKISKVGNGSASGPSSSNVPGVPSSQQRSQFDTDKEVGVLTRYALDAYLSGKFGEKDSVDFVIRLRDAVKERLVKKAGDDSADIKLKTVLTRLDKIDAKLKDNPGVIAFVTAQLESDKNFNRLVGDLDACVKGEKVLQLTPDGRPAFVYGS